MHMHFHLRSLSILMLELVFLLSVLAAPYPGISQAIEPSNQQENNAENPTIEFTKAVLKSGGDDPTSKTITSHPELIRKLVGLLETSYYSIKLDDKKGDSLVTYRAIANLWSSYNVNPPPTTTSPTSPLVIEKALYMPGASIQRKQSFLISAVWGPVHRKKRQIFMEYNEGRERSSKRKPQVLRKGGSTPSPMRVAS
ncbi:hypothetical protein ABKN59_010904 [Abortiporus biennis]